MEEVNYLLIQDLNRQTLYDTVSPVHTITSLFGKLAYKPTMIGRQFLCTYFTVFFK